jgi:hypothetical protein
MPKNKNRGSTQSRIPIKRYDDFVPEPIPAESVVIGGDSLEFHPARSLAKGFA